MEIIKRIRFYILQSIRNWSLPDYTRGGSTANPPPSRNIQRLKRIWNYFFGKKKSKVRSYRVNYSTGEVLGEIKEPSKLPHSSPVPETDRALEEMLKPKKRHTQLFRNQQLPGKIYNIGKSRFRIHDRISGGNKFKYHVEKLTSLL